MIVVIVLLLILSSCAPTWQTTYPDRCDVKQTDSDGKGYTVGYFPCKLHHIDGTPSGDRPPRQEP